MGLLYKLFYLVALVPGLLQVLTFFILLGLFAFTGKFAAQRVPVSLIGTGSLLLVFVYWMPFWVLTHVIIVALGFIGLKSQFKNQILLAVMAFFFFGLGYYQTSDVKVVFPSNANWKIGERGLPESGNPPERLVEFTFGRNFNQVSGRYSDRLADFLINKNVTPIPIQVPIFYSWGVAHAMGELIIDGQEFPSSGGGYAGWSGDRPESPFPKYYFGLKSF